MDKNFETFSPDFIKEAKDNESSHFNRIQFVASVLNNTKIFARIKMFTYRNKCSEELVRDIEREVLVYTPNARHPFVEIRSGKNGSFTYDIDAQHCHPQRKMDDEEYFAIQKISLNYMKDGKIFTFFTKRVPGIHRAKINDVTDFKSIHDAITFKEEDVEYFVETD